MAPQSLPKRKAVTFTMRFQVFLHAVLFVLGMSTIIVFVFGGATTILGRVLYDARDWITRIGGIVVIIFGLHTLNGLQGLQVVPVGDVVSDDQIRVVTATDLLHPQRVHLAEDVGRTKGDTAVGAGRPGLIAPELPLAAVNAADDAGCRGTGNQKLEAADAAGDRAVTVDTH